MCALTVQEANEIFSEIHTLLPYMTLDFHITFSFYCENLCFRDAVALLLPLASQGDEHMGPTKVSKMFYFLSGVVVVTQEHILLHFFKLHISSYRLFIYMIYFII